jgi:histidinol-phosphate aminotransferase
MSTTEHALNQGTRAALAAVASYKQGRTLEPGADVVKLSSNELPFAPLPSVRAAIEAGLDRLNRYPLTAAPELTTALAARFQVDPERIVYGAGSVEIVSQFIRATCAEGDEVIYAWRSFEAYPMLVRTAGAAPVEVALTADHRHDLPAMLEAITERTRLIIVCNPNNPTGTTVAQEDLEAFLAAVPASIPVLLDEAYHQFDDGLAPIVGTGLLERFPQLSIAHTFSKAYGLAGLRVGYAIAPAALAADLRKVSVPFGVTDLAQRAAVTSLGAQAELDERVASVLAERHRVVSTLETAGWSLPETRANFLWLPLGADTEDAVAVLERHGILVRPFPGEGLRVTIAEVEGNDRLLAGAAELVELGLTGGLVQR